MLKSYDWKRICVIASRRMHVKIINFFESHVIKESMDVEEKLSQLLLSPCHDPPF